MLIRKDETMAKVTLDPMFQKLSGHLGNIVHYNRFGRQYCRIHVIPANPRTESQQALRATFADAVRSWQNLSHDEQAAFNHKARYKTITGYNLYISLFMKANMPAAAATESAAVSNNVFPQSADGNPEAFSSVALPFMRADILYSCLKRAAVSPDAG